MSTDPQFIEQTLEQELGRLTRHIAECHGVWQRASEGLRSGDVDRQNLALDEIIRLREAKW